jgi:transposase
MPNKARVFSREFKLVAVRRMLAREKVQALAVELGLSRQALYKWWDHHERGGPEALRPTGRPRTARVATPEPTVKRGGAPERIAELDARCGQPALELDFFKQALRHVKAPPLASDGRGATVSSPSSRR